MYTMGIICNINERSEPYFAESNNHYLRLPITMRVRLKHKSGITDAISAEFAKKVIEETGMYSKQDWVSINEGPWKSCSCIKDVKFEENYYAFDLRSSILIAVYEESNFKKFYEICNGDENEIYNLIDEEDILATIQCTSYYPDPLGKICYEITITKSRLVISIVRINEKKIYKYKSLNAVDKYGNKLYEEDESLLIPFWEIEFGEEVDEEYREEYEKDKADCIKGMLTLELLKERICSPSHDNSINIKANVRYDDGAPELIEFTIPPMLINRIGKCNRSRPIIAVLGLVCL